MKRITITSMLLLLTGIGLGFSRPPDLQSGSTYQANERLGIEITTDSCHEVLYVPVGRTKGKGFIATIPVAGGGAVSAVRISPVMENGKVRFDVHFVYGRYSRAISSDDLKLQPAVLISSRGAAKGETVVVKDDISANSSWSVNIKAVELRKNPTTVGKNLEFLKPSVVPFMRHYTSTTQDLKVDDTGGCGCAWCGDLMVCPARGKCILTTCGNVCCPNG